MLLLSHHDLHSPVTEHEQRPRTQPQKSRLAPFAAAFLPLISSSAQGFFSLGRWSGIVHKRKVIKVRQESNKSFRVPLPIGDLRSLG